jgi:hypothetical protein
MHGAAARLLAQACVTFQRAAGSANRPAAGQRQTSGLRGEAQNAYASPPGHRPSAVGRSAKVHIRMRWAARVLVRILAKIESRLANHRAPLHRDPPCSSPTAHLNHLTAPGQRRFTQLRAIRASTATPETTIRRPSPQSCSSGPDDPALLAHPLPSATRPHRARRPRHILTGSDFDRGPRIKQHPLRRIAASRTMARIG